MSKKPKRKWKVTLNSKWRDAFNQTISIGQKTADVLLTLSSLRNKPRRADYIAAGMKLADVGLGFIEFEQEEKLNPLHDWLTSGENKDIFWTNIYEETAFAEEIIDILRKEYPSKIIFQEEALTVKTANINGVVAAWSEIGGQIDEGPLVPDDKVDDIYSELSEHVWKRINSDHCKVVEHDSGFKFVKDELADDVLPSKAADDAVERVKKYLDHPEVGSYITRAIFFYGRQGTGKSTAIRMAVKKLGMRSIRIGFYSIDEDVSSEVIPAIKILKPQVLIIDDIDRCRDKEFLLEQLEEFRKRVRVIFASANYPKTMDRAILRPGRFDETIELEKLDAEVIGRLVGDNVPVEIKERLGELPIAYVNEFSLCRKVLGDEEAFKRVDELHTQLELGRGFNDDD